MMTKYLQNMFLIVDKSFCRATMSLFSTYKLTCARGILAIMDFLFPVLLIASGPSAHWSSVLRYMATYISLLLWTETFVS